MGLSSQNITAPSCVENSVKLPLSSSKLRIFLLLACCDHFCGTVSAHTSIPGRCDGDVILRPTLQCAEVTAAACTTAIVSVTCVINCSHRVYDPRSTVVPGYRHSAAGAVDRRKEGLERTGSWEGECEDGK